MNPPLRTGWLSVLLNLFGVAVVTYALFASYTGLLGTGRLALGVVGLLAWVGVVVVSVVETRSGSAGGSGAVPAGEREAGAGTVAGSAGARNAERPVGRTGAGSWLLPVLCAVMAVCGAFIAAPTFGLGVALTVAALLRVIGTPRWPLWWGGALTLASLALVALGAIVGPADGDALTASPSGISALGLLAIEGGIVIAALGGLSRRQLRLADSQAEALREERLAAREKLAALDALAQRQEIAREIHDLLAHSLGGLVIQLDAVDALLEAGETAAAEIRVRDARKLAASGLNEARRAVDALREPIAAPPVAADALIAGIEDLVAAERRLGAAVRLHVGGVLAGTETTARAATGARVETGAKAGAGVETDARAATGAEMGAEAGAGAETGVRAATSAGAETDTREATGAEALVMSGDAAAALRRAVQEALTNARKHAAGAAVEVEVTAGGGGDGAWVRAIVSNPLGGPLDALGSTGAAHGLSGMRERFDRLPGARLVVGASGGRFVVDTQVPAHTEVGASGDRFVVDAQVPAHPEVGAFGGPFVVDAQVPGRAESPAADAPTAGSERLGS
ncbi:histidine kinase [Subtercola sp. YIM 133946]|uniref:histidine kinase n=1 Tax=Subtercola sp. YIM 133946 TaxID=3118909 RepID=UPI002F921A3E